MKFAKRLQREQLPGFSGNYVDYKGLKKIINSLAKGRFPDAALLAAGVRPPPPSDHSTPNGSQEPLGTAEPLLLAHTSAVANAALQGQTTGTGTKQGELLQAHKAAFFFKLERELEKINGFYHQRESLLKVRLRALIDQRKLLQARLAGKSSLNGSVPSLSRDSSNYGALYEGFRNFERDLGRLQAYVELNATAFRKICKKWDKACRRQADRFGQQQPQQGEHDGQLYLARQVEAQPVFNRDFIAELSDVASANLLSLDTLLSSSSNSLRGSENLADGPRLPTLWTPDGMEALEDLELALVRAVKLGDRSTVKEVLASLARCNGGGEVKRILWRAALEEEGGAKASPSGRVAEEVLPPTAAPVTGVTAVDGATTPRAREPVLGLDQIETLAVPNLDSDEGPIPMSLLDFDYVDDINSRTSLHEAATAGRLPLVQACLGRGVSLAQADVYGRQPLHYAAINGHTAVCRALVIAGADPTTPDLDGYSPIIYSVTNGHASVVEAFIEQGVAVESQQTATEELNPLSLACQFGHEDIARLLLTRGAQVRPNPAGYCPQHLAAQGGHAGVLRLLVEATRGFSGIDVPDKYSQLTPLAHAASEGHAECVQVLLQAGSDVHARDEFGKTPIHYAAWQGHIDCVNLLLAAGSTAADAATPLSPEGAVGTGSMSSAEVEPMDPMDLEGDLIPSLSLPPPAIPLRIYGHQFLAGKCLVHVTLGHPNTSRAPFPPPVRLSEQSGRGQHPSLKLVLTPRADPNAATHNVILPLADEREVFPFQVDDIDNFSLEFEVFPTFGNRVVGKAVALPGMFAGLKSQGSYTVPLMDPHLKVIGDVPFEVSVVKPFESARLMVGGQFETYWKSTTTVGGGDAQPQASAQAGPSVVTASSLSGEHVRVVVQVTADGVPVAWPNWTLPVNGLDVHVGDVTAAQFTQLAKRLGLELDPTSVTDRLDPAGWYQAVHGSLVTLDVLLKTLPPSLGVNLEVRYPTRSDFRRLNLQRTLEVNKYVDCVLSSVYESIQAGGDKAPLHHRIVFSSFNPVVVSTLNWKQPNFSVFFASYCGLSRSSPEGKMVPANRVEDDRRCTSIREAVKFAKANNLLGVLLDATILLQVPSLIQSAKEYGLLICTFGTNARITLADAHMRQGVLSYASDSFLARTEAS